MDNINEEGRRELERLKREYLVDPDEVEVFKCQELLRKMYECHEMMGELLDGKTKDLDYESMTILIKRLENHLQSKQDLL